MKIIIIIIIIKKKKKKKNREGGGREFGSEGRQDRIFVEIFSLFFSDYRYVHICILCMFKWSGHKFEFHLIIKSDRKATETNRLHSNDLEACGKKCCYFMFHSEVKFLTRF